MGWELWFFVPLVDTDLESRPTCEEFVDLYHTRQTCSYWKMTR